MCYDSVSDASRELISREFSRMNFKKILENEYFILEKWRKDKSTLIYRFEGVQYIFKAGATASDDASRFSFSVYS